MKLTWKGLLAIHFAQKRKFYFDKVATGIALQSFISFLIYNCAEIAFHILLYLGSHWPLLAQWIWNFIPWTVKPAQYVWLVVSIPRVYSLCILLTSSHIADGYTTDDILYLWKDTDPVQIAQNLSLPRFSIENYASSYCNVKTNTGKFNATLLDAFPQPCNMLWEKKAFSLSLLS